MLEICLFKNYNDEIPKDIVTEYKKFEETECVKMRGENTIDNYILHLKEIFKLNPDWTMIIINSGNNKIVTTTNHINILTAFKDIKMVIITKYWS